MKHIHLTIFLVICISVDFSLGDNNDIRLNDALRNSTKSRLSGQYNTDNNNAQQNGDNNREDDNVLKSEAQRMLKQCGVEKNNTSDNNENKFGRNGFGNNDRNGYGGSSSNYGNSNSGSNMGNNYNQYGQGQGNNDGSSSNSNEGWNTYGSQNWNRNQNSGSNYNGNSNKRQSDYSNQQPNYGQSNSGSDRFSNSGSQNGFGNQNSQDGNYGNQDDRHGSGYDGSSSQNGQASFNNNDQGYNSRGSNRGSQSSSTNMYGMRSPNTGFNRGGAQEDDCRNADNRDFNSNGFGYNNGMTFGFNRQHRQKRYNYFNRGENEGNDDNQCISQCVFGYLHMLDDDRSPSETMLIKWLQEHVTGSDMDRIKALRDARRCFGRLTTNDIEDGCEFSKELANCLELDLE